MFLTLTRTGDQRCLPLIRRPEGRLVTELPSVSTKQADLFAALEVPRPTAAGF